MGGYTAPHFVSPAVPNMQKIVKTIAWIVLIAGLIAGPGYWLHARYFGASEHAEHPLLPNGPHRWQSPALTLTPEMSPVGLSFRGTWSPPAAAPGAPPLPPPRFQATLWRNAQAAEPIRFSLRDGGKKAAFEERLLLLNIPEAAEYRLEIEAFGHPDSIAQLNQPTLLVQQNVESADPRIVSAGILAAALAALLLLSL